MKIGIVGLAGAGKDTAAVMLAQLLKAEIDRFAAPLKLAAAYAFGSHFDERSIKEMDFQCTWQLEDRMLEGAIQCVQALGFSEEEENKASELYFEHIGDHYNELSPRKYQQLLGTEVVRAVRKSAFVDRIAASTAEYLIVPDCRFDNEEAVFDKLLFIDRDAVTPEEVPEHPSEHLAFNYAWGGVRPANMIYVPNNGTPAELASWLKSILKEF